MIPRTLSFIAAGVLATSLAVPAMAGDSLELGNFRADYEVERSGLTIGEITVTLERPGTDQYRYTAKTVPVGIARFLTSDTVTETSEGNFRDGELKPTQYLYQREGSDREKSTRIRFDWEAKQALNDDGETAWKMNIFDGVQDKFGHQLSVMLSLAKGDKEAAFQVADGGHLKEYRFTVVGEERIRTPAGEFDTMKVTRSKNKDPSNYTLWLDPERGFLPVRIDRLDNNVRMSLVKAEGRAVINGGTTDQGLGSVTPR